MAEEHTYKDQRDKRREPRDLQKEQHTGAGLVSVIIPCYNQAHFLGEAIESVLAQSYRFYEIVVVDDGSPDNTSEVAARYPEVRCIRQENQGQAGARNTGSRESEGEYLVFLDADDRLLPEALEVGVKNLKARPECAFVSGRFRNIEANGVPVPSWEQPEQPCPDKDHYLEILRCNYTILPAVAMYRRSVFEAVGGFNTSLSILGCKDYFEDYELYVRMARYFPVHCHGEVVAAYRQHASSTTRNSAKMLKAGLAVLRAERSYVKGSKRHEEAIQVGMKDIKGHWGRQLAYKVLTQLREREWKWAMRDLLVLMRYYPGAFVHACRKLLKVPVRLLRPLSALWRQHRAPPVGRVGFGSLRQLTPISRDFGYDRGRPINRYYIENFLARHADDVQGRVLEIGDDSYTRRYGGSRVTRSDVLHVTQGNPRATIVADLSHADHVQSDAFDCIIFTETLHLIYDVRSVIQALHRILRPGGILLATFPGISQIAHEYKWGDWYWAFTALSARQLFEETFPAPNVEVEAHGNVLAAISFLHGLAVEELRQEELDYCDPSFEVSITLRAVKPEAPP